MTAKHFCVIGKSEQTRADRLAEFVKVAARKVSAANATAEKGIASEDPTLNRSVKTDATTGVTWGGNHFQNAIADFNLLVIL